MKINNEGQSTIEFIVTFAFTLGILFMVYGVARNFTNGYLVHYGTYMAARAYMVFDNNSNDPNAIDTAAEAWTREVYKDLGIERLVPAANRLNFNGPADGFSTSQKRLYQGVFVDYRESFILPTFGNTKPLNLRSEAFLGREPTRIECFQRVCQAMGAIAGGCLRFTTVADNGC